MNVIMNVAPSRAAGVPVHRDRVGLIFY